MRFAPLLAALAALAFAAAPASALDAAGPCVNYAFVHDYQWHYLCVEPKDTSCPVYTRVSNGVSWGPKSCIVEAPAANVQAPPRCVLIGHDLDYSHYVCHDLGNPSCPVYYLRSSGGHEVKTCL